MERGERMSGRMERAWPSLMKNGPAHSNHIRRQQSLSGTGRVGGWGCSVEVKQLARMTAGGHAGGPSIAYRAT